MHPELTRTPLLFWGHSAGAGFATTFASQFPDRTIAFVRYHVGGDPATDLSVVSRIPALILTGGKEFNAYNGVTSEALWRRGRALGAPWTFGIEPNATHGDERDLEKALPLIIQWIRAVVERRLSPNVRGLKSITDRDGWLGDNHTGEVAPYTTFNGQKADASWLPDANSGRAWRALIKQ